MTALSSSTAVLDSLCQRVAHVIRSSYEWTQHVAVAKNAGVNDDEIAQIAVDGPVTALDAEGSLLCRVADEMP